MVSFIRNVSFEGSDPYALAEFWSGVIGHPIHPECGPGDAEVAIEPPAGPRLFFQAVPEGKRDEAGTDVGFQLREGHADRGGRRRAIGHRPGRGGSGNNWTRTTIFTRWSLVGQTAASASSAAIDRHRRHQGANHLIKMTLDQ